MNENEKTVTINKEYDGNLKKIKSESGFSTFLCSPIGYACAMFVCVTIGVVLLYLAEEYYIAAGYSGREASLVLAKQMIKMGAILLCVIVLYSNILDLRKHLKTFKYARRLPKNSVDFERLGIPTYGEYVEFMLTNLFTYEGENDFILKPNCAFLSDKEIKDSLLAAIAYYNSIGKLTISESNIRPVYVKGDNTYLKCPPELAALRPAFIIESIFRHSDFPEKIKVYVDKNKDIHLLSTCNKGGRLYFDEAEYGLLDANISKINGNSYYGYYTKKPHMTCECYEGSIFNTKTCEFTTNNDQKMCMRYLTLLIIPAIINLLLKNVI